MHAANGVTVYCAARVDGMTDVYSIDPSGTTHQLTTFGEQYRSVIFAYSDEQRKVAEEVKAALEKLGSWQAAEPKFAQQLVRYFSRLPRVMAAYCARDAYKRLGAKLAGNADWQKWFLANRALFETGTSS